MCTAHGSCLSTTYHIVSEVVCNVTLACAYLLYEEISLVEEEDDGDISEVSVVDNGAKNVQ